MAGINPEEITDLPEKELSIDPVLTAKDRDKPLMAAEKALAKSDLSGEAIAGARLSDREALAKSDLEIVKMALADQEDFIFIIKRYKQKLFNYISRITNVCPEDAEDILQEVFIKIYLNLNDFDESLKFSSWVYRITHNQVISRHRRLKARPEGNALALDDNIAKAIADDLDIKKDVDLKILRKNIFSALDKMDEKHKEILVLKFFEEKSYQEISDIIKKPMGTVASLLSRAKEKFGEEFKAAKY